MDHRRRILVLAMSAAALTGTNWAGSLEPPAGPVGPTMKTLDEVEPRRPIHQSDLPLTIFADGSYYLAENLYANQNGVDMITVTAATVSIDLRGFTIFGTSELAQAADGIQVNASVRSFSLSNGFIRGCAGNGVNSFSNDLTVSVSRVQLTLNSEGLIFGGTNATGVISECVAKSNNLRGILLTKGVVENSVATGNGAIGIQMLSGLVRGCSSRDNGASNVQAQGNSVVVDTYAP